MKIHRYCDVKLETTPYGNAARLTAGIDAPRMISRQDAAIMLQRWRGVRAIVAAYKRRIGL